MIDDSMQEMNSKKEGVTLLPERNISSSNEMKMDDSNQERMSDVSNNTMEHTPITTESAPNTKDEITIIDRLGNVGVVSVKARRQIAARCQAASARRQVTAMATGGKKSDVSRKRTEPHIFQKIVHVPILFWLRAHL